ncbi:MAG: 50S ribosomal protein L15 [Candidatus Thorarchaeota archaeon]|nr:50S ribosomal protein L15 [Candidatus Thorarchaeota archaeon]
MQKRKERKIRGHRGDRTTGYGVTKGHRAAGQRGGRGNAGRHKHRWIATIKENPHYFGKHGFKRFQGLTVSPTTINIGQLDETVEHLVEQGRARKDGKKYVLDMPTLGVEKVLGRGRVVHALELTGVRQISASAREKIIGAGGSVDLPE